MITPYVDEEELQKVNEELDQEEQQVAEAYTQESMAPTTAEQQMQADAQNPDNVEPISAEQQANEQFNLGEAARNVAEGGLAIPAGIVDFGMDAVGMVPGLGFIDDAWDENTKFKNPLFQKAREVASIVVPSVMAGLGVARAVATLPKMPAILKGLTSIGAAAAADVAVTGISDTSYEHNAARTLNDAFGWNLPNATLDSDSPEVRKQKNIYESVGMSIVGDAIGLAVGIGRGPMKWFKPKDKVAEAYKASEAVINGEPKTMEYLSNLRSQLDSIDAEVEAAALNNMEAVIPGLLKQKKALQKQADDVLSEYMEKGYTRVTENPVESAVEANQISRELQTEEAALRKLEANPGSIDADPDITPSMFPEGASARQSVPPGNVARNAADVAAIKRGVASGDPTPVVTDAMNAKFLDGSGVPRQEIKEIADAARQAGDYDAIVNGFRFTRKDMSDEAWRVYADIMGADDANSLRKLFASDFDVKTMLDGRKVRYMTEVQAHAAAFAMRDLTDRYLGKEVTEASARAMDTLGREISTISEAYKTLPEAADEVRVTDMIFDKLTFLYHEYGVNKYISGWQLAMKKKWGDTVKAGDEAIKAITEEFDDVMKIKKQQAIAFGNTLKELRTENPAALRPLIDAFAATNGDVDTLAKLVTYTNNQLNPMGLLKKVGNTEGMNAFAQGMWSVRYNNILSGLSALRAAAGNTTLLTMKPINAMIGAGMESLFTGSFKPIRRAMYAYGSFWETNRRAFGDAWRTFKQVSANPEDYMSMARADLVTVKRDVWDVLDGMAKVWEKEGDTGKLFMYNWARLNKDVANSSFMRWGTNAMIGADAYVNTTMATHISRFKAWDEVATKAGTFNAKVLKEAEAKHYAAIFDKTGMIKDEAVKHASGEVAMNLDDSMASAITELTTKLPALKPLFMFPRTGVNSVKMAMSYTPLAALPWMEKTSKILLAGDDITKITEALALHGIDAAKTPGAMALYKGIQAEYRGRMAMGALLTAGLWSYAMGGNIRGNGPVNPAERRKLKDMNWKEKTINIGGKWVSYQNLEPFDTILSLLGDASYYARDVGSSVMQDIQDKIMWSIAATFTNKTFMAGLEPLVAIANGDETAAARLLANEARSYIPMSGAVGVAAQAWSSSQKDIYNDFIGYIQNRVPGVNGELPEQIDVFTGKPLKDIDNPILRGLNAINPVPISGGDEPWRQWLLETGWDGMSMIRKDSSGSYEYNSKEREILYRYIGEQQLYKQVEKLMNSPKMNDQLGRLRAYRAQGWSSERIRMEAKDLDLYKRLDAMMSDARKKAEIRLQQENPEIWNTIKNTKISKKQLNRGRVDDARRTADTNDQQNAEIQRLIELYK